MKHSTRLCILSQNEICHFCCALKRAVLAHALDVNFWPRAWKNNTFVNILLSHPRAITVFLLSVRAYLVCVQSLSPVTQGVADYQANDVIKWAWRNPVLPFVLFQVGQVRTRTYVVSRRRMRMTQWSKDWVWPAQKAHHVTFPQNNFPLSSVDIQTNGRTKRKAAW